jgi:hypothetical protein
MSSGGTNIEIKNITVTYISTKTDKYDNTVCYFKVTDTKAKKKLSPILSQRCEECRLPLWDTDSSEYMIKVKQKYAPKLLVADTALTVLLTFKYYCMEVDGGAVNQGYYALMKVLRKSSPSDEDEDDTLPLGSAA